MKIREINEKNLGDEYADIEEMTTALLDGEILGSHALNSIFYHVGLFDEDVICAGVNCRDCPHNPIGLAFDCAELASAYARQRILDKVHRRISVEDIL